MPRVLTWDPDTSNRLLALEALRVDGWTMIAADSPPTIASSRYPSDAAMKLLLLRHARKGYWHIVAGVFENGETFGAAEARERLGRFPQVWLRRRSGPWRVQSRVRIATDAAGFFYVVDSGYHHIQKFAQ